MIFSIPNNTMWTTPGSQVFPKCGIGGPNDFLSEKNHPPSRPAQSASESKARISPGAGWFLAKGAAASVRNISSSASGKCSPDRMRICGAFAQCNVHIDFLDVIMVVFWLPTCNLQDATCYQTDWLQFWGWSKMCRDRASHCKMLFKLPPWMTMSMVYKASILSDFRIFQVKRDVLKNYQKDFGEHIILSWRM